MPLFVRGSDYIPASSKLMALGLDIPGYQDGVVEGASSSPPPGLSKMASGGHGVSGTLSLLQSSPLQDPQTSLQDSFLSHPCFTIL